uniref:1-phosphatidylinositol 4-kinase n=1 Tax=Tetraselmis sp. GSL018 TaxID=582737 RepID=A0A061RS87_9CHLO
MALSDPVPITCKALAPANPAGCAQSDGEIFVMLAVDHNRDAHEATGGAIPASYETFNAFPGETVRDVKLRLLAKNGHYSRGQMVIFGDRELGEHEQLGPLAESISGGSDYLHLFVRISDIERVEVVTSHRSISRGVSDSPVGAPAGRILPPYDPPPQSLGGCCEVLGGSMVSFAPQASSVTIPSCALMPVPEDEGSSPPPEAGHSRDFVHLMVRRSANRKLHYVVKGEVFELVISASDSTEDVTKQIVKARGADASRPHALLYNGRQLEASAPLVSHGLRAGARLELAPLAGPVPLPGSPPLSSSAHALYKEWQEAREGLELGYSPRLAGAGSGGSYFLLGKDGTSYVAVFKPEDEEPQARNNPRGLVGSEGGGSEGLRRGVLPGEGASREVAAYLLDHDHFAGVPPTAMVNCFMEADGAGKGHSQELKRGSLQQFVKFDADCEEQSPRAFDPEVCHRIFVLDLRLANCDRNASNILARRTEGGWKLTPIDHGYCLPGSLQDVSFEWLYWPQAEVPFSEATREYIAKLDAERDIEILEANGLEFRPECLRTLRVCTALLKKGAAAGMAPAAIGRLMTREFLTMSPLEKLHKQAVQAAVGCGLRPGCPRRLTEASEPLDEAAYMAAMCAGIDEMIDEVALDGVCEL